MPIDPDVAIGAELGSLDFSWSDSDVAWSWRALSSRKRPRATSIAGKRSAFWNGFTR